MLLKNVNTLDDNLVFLREYSEDFSGNALILAGDYLNLIPLLIFMIFDPPIIPLEPMKRFWCNPFL